MADLESIYPEENYNFGESGISNEESSLVEQIIDVKIF